MDYEIFMRVFYFKAALFQTNLKCFPFFCTHVQNLEIE